MEYFIILFFIMVINDFQLFAIIRWRKEGFMEKTKLFFESFERFLKKDYDLCDIL